jgi:AcrR family transcriptional regulator
MTAAERREQLLDVARDLVGEGGFASVTVEAVARRAGITRPIVYGHFEDLSALLQAMLDRESGRALRQLAAVLPDLTADLPRRDALLAALRGFLESVKAEPVTWRLVLMPPDGAPALLRERIREGRDAVVAALAEFVRPGLAPGRPSPDPALTARMLSALSDEAARLLLTDPGEYPVERLMAQGEWLLGQLTA